MTESPVHFAYALGDGKPSAAHPFSAPKPPFWLHVGAAHPEGRRFLEAQLGAEKDTAIDAMLAQSTRPVLLTQSEGLVLILRGVNLSDGADPEDMISIRLWADATRVISVGLRQLRTVGDLEAAITAGHGPTRPGALVAALAERITQRMEPVMEALDDAVAGLEQAVLDAPGQDIRAEVRLLRRRAIILRRYLAPQREALSATASTDVAWLTAEDRRSLRLAADRMARFVEDLDALRDRAQVIAEELAATLSARLDRNLYVLSVISAIFLPLGFLTGLLGVNVGGVPLTGSDAGFWIVTAGLALIGAGTVALLRWMRWF